MLTIGVCKQCLAVLVHERLMMNGLQQKVGASHQAVHFILLLQKDPQALLYMRQAAS